MPDRDGLTGLGFGLGVAATHTNDSQQYEHESRCEEQSRFSSLDLRITGRDVEAARDRPAGDDDEDPRDKKDYRDGEDGDRHVSPEMVIVVTRTLNYSDAKSAK